MKMMSIIEIAAAMEYDPETGILKRIDGVFKDPVKDRCGHLLINAGGRRVLAHRIAWACFYKTEPVGQIDHINGVPWDNRISNLRIATNAENQWNAKINKNNKSGVKGLWFDSKFNRWRGAVKANGKRYQTRSFLPSEFDIAAKEVNALRASLHGAFARHV